MTKTYYQACRLRRASAEQVRYIPESFAFVGKILKVQQADGTWEDGWRVQQVEEKRVPLKAAQP